MRVRGRAVATGGLLLAVILAWCPGARALDPALDVNQYAHTSWRIRDGFTKGIINSIAQTPDGYLLLGTEFGLYRFDGIRADPWQPPFGQTLASSDIRALLTARDGTLWIGTAKGLASWKDGKLTNYPELADLIIVRLLEDHQGTVWAGAYGVPAGRLCAFQKGSVQCYGEDGGLGPVVIRLFEDSKSNLWAGVRNGLWRWKPGPPKFYALQGEADGVKGLAEESDGAILIGWKGGIYKVINGKTVKYPATDTVPEFHTESMLRDRDGGLWIGTKDRGLLHVHRGRTDVFSSPNGLSGELAHCLFEDREGTMWVATLDGLDRFRDFAVSTLSTKEGLSNPLVGSVLAAKDGRVWLGTGGGLNRWFNGQISSFGRQDGKVNGHAPSSLFQDSHGRIWFSTFFEFGYLENEGFVSIHGIPAGNVHGIGEDFEGSLWIANNESGLLRLSPGNEIQEFPWTNLKPGDYAIALAVDPLQGGLWLGFSRGGIAYFADGQVRQTYSTTDGLGEGQVANFRLDPDGTLWAATEGGLSRLKNGHIMTLTSKNGLPCDTVHWSMEDDAHSLWLYMECGLVRIVGPELSNWIAAVDKDKNAKRTIQSTVFDVSDGVRVHTPGGYSPSVAKSTDGRLWFLPFDGVSVVDPAHLPFNKLPPPVHIEQITADRKTYDPASYAKGQVPLPARTRDLQIEYTALSLVAPEKVRFRYKLEGRDPDWQDAGNRRQAFYTDLPPRGFRFRVMACNNSGVWNETGAFLDFSIAPAYYQTNWFRALLLAAFLGLFWAFYQIRLRRLAREFNAGLEARVNERTRIARELHDTLLQDFQAMILRFHSISRRLVSADPNRIAMDEGLSYADRVLREGRNRIRDIRADTKAPHDLAKGFADYGNELSQRRPVTLDLKVIGAQFELDPIVRDEIYRIGREALGNAFKHSGCSKIEIKLAYADSEFQMEIRDDGKGIDSAILGAGGTPGHWGMYNMKERAEKIGASLKLSSPPNAGTILELKLSVSSFKRSLASWFPWRHKRISTNKSS